MSVNGQGGGSTAAKAAPTRRDLLKASAILGAGGLGVGALGGFAAGRGTASATGGGGGAGGPAGRPLRIVAPLDGSGSQAATADEFRLGAEIAIDEINALGGVNGHPLEWDEHDIGNVYDANDVRSGWTEVVEGFEPDLIAAPFAGAMGPDLDVAADAGIIYMNGSTREDWRNIYQSDPERYWPVFQVDPAETAYGTGFALFLDQLVESGEFEAREKTVAVIAGDDPYGTHIADTFQAGIQDYGWTIHSRSSTTIGTVVDWGPVLAPLRSNPPTCVFSTNAGIADNATMARQWVDSPLPSLLYQQYAPSEAEYLELAGDAANGVVWSTVLGLQADAISEEFRRKFRERYDREPSWAYAGQAYDIVHLWAKAVALAGDVDDARKIARILEYGSLDTDVPGIHPLAIHRGVTGGISFPRDHTVSSYPSEIDDPSLGQPHVIAQIREGAHVQIYPEPFVNGEFEVPPWI